MKVVSKAIAVASLPQRIRPAVDVSPSETRGRRLTRPLVQFV